MPTAQQTAPDTAVYSFAKSKTEEIRASVSEYRGKTRLDLRSFVPSDAGMVPTKKGVSITVEQLPDLEAAVAALRAAVTGGQ